MMRLFKICALAALAAVSTTLAWAGPEEIIRSKLQQAVPGTVIKSVKPAALPGFYEVSIPGATVYASADGEYVLQGELLQIKGKQVINLTEQAQASARVGLIRGIDKRQTVIFPANGKPKAVLTVFTDTHCGYCRKLHQEVPAMNQMGIEVRYLAYPRDLPRVGANAGTGAELANIWCSGNPGQAMTMAKQGQSIPAGRKGCKAPIAEQFALGQQMGVTGTPAIFDEKGRQLGGYITAKQAAQRLGLN
ncbi:MAG: DsbC family protein [Pseudomonadota bacterium]